MLAIIPGEGSVVDAELVRSFRRLASCGMVKPGSPPGHVDGWGMVSWREGRPFYLARRPSDAWKDPGYEKACKEIQSLRMSSPLIVHLRKASVGEKRVENTHPFIVDDWAFAHNGTIRKQNLRGKTDSEWFFELLIQEKRLSNSDMAASVKRHVDSIKSVYEYSSLAFLLSNGIDFFAYRDCSEHAEYYSMFYTRLNGATVFCQEKFFDSSWTELGNSQLVRFRGGELQELEQGVQPSAKIL